MLGGYFFLTHPVDWKLKDIQYGFIINGWIWLLQTGKERFYQFFGFYAFCVVFDGWELEMGQIVHLSAVFRVSPRKIMAGIGCPTQGGCSSQARTLMMKHRCRQMRSRGIGGLETRTPTPPSEVKKIHIRLSCDTNRTRILIYTMKSLCSV